MRGSPGRLLLPVLLFLALLLGGCLGAAPPTAMEAQAVSDPLSGTLAGGDHRLVFAAGLEGRAEDGLVRDLLRDSWSDHLGLEVPGQDASDSYWDLLQEDPRVGDGRAPIWVFVYGEAGHENETVFLVSGSQVLHEEVRAATAQNAAVGDYQVDSDRAMQIALDSEPALRGLLGTGNLIIGSGLAMDAAHGGPVWTISGIGGDQDGVGGAWVQLDAVTGVVIHSEGRSLG